MLTDAEWLTLRMKFEGDTAAAIVAARARAAAEEKRALEEDPNAPIDRKQPLTDQWPLNVLLAERTKAREVVGVDAIRQSEVRQDQQQIANDQVTLTRLEAQLENASGAKTRRAEHIALLRSLYVEVFEQLVQEETVLKTLYAPLRDRLKTAKGALAKLAFIVQRRVDLETWSKRGEQLFDLRAGTRFKGHGAIREHAERLLLPAWSTGAAEDVAAAMEFFRDELHKELRRMPPWIDLDERLAWNKNVAAWLYDTSHITIRHGIDRRRRCHRATFTRDPWRCTAVAVSRRRHPGPAASIVDQPEENLDPNSVFEELVPHFREARKRRQVIIVTHNANLVVNTDADQVLVASSARNAAAALPDISYQSGSLENPAIRGLVCQILEGGERAFLERERRYRLRWGQNLLEEP